jgi:hypothetical protein
MSIWALGGCTEPSALSGTSSVNLPIAHLHKYHRHLSLRSTSRIGTSAVGRNNNSI